MSEFAGYCDGDSDERMELCTVKCSINRRRSTRPVEFIGILISS